MIRWAGVGLFVLGVPLACGSESRNFAAAGAGGGTSAQGTGAGGRLGDGAAASGAPDYAPGAAGETSVGGGLDEGGAAGASAAGATGNLMRCDPTKPFAAPMVVPGVNAANDYRQRRLSVDGLKMFLWRGSALLSATRVSADTPFGVPAQDPNLVDAATFLLQSQELSTPTFSADSLTLYAHFGGQGNDLIYEATRQLVTGKFGTPAPSGIGVGNSAPTMYGDDPFISADGNSLYLDAGGDLYAATKTAGKFGMPAALRLVNTVGSSAGWETEPVPTADELKLYFASTRTDGNPKGKNDIWVSQRTSKSGEFGAPKLVAEINTTADDYPVWVSDDDCEIFLDSYDPDSQTVEVFSSRRPM